MLKHSAGLWRIEYMTDLTKARSAIVPVGYLLEAHWSNDARWLGLLFRKRLTPVELDRINIETWPEMTNLEAFMKLMFDQAWEADGEAGATPALGSETIAQRYNPMSALQFTPDEVGVKLDDEDVERSFPGLYARLLGFHANLAPVLTAPVVKMPRRAVAAAPPREDVQQLLQQAA